MIEVNVFQQPHDWSVVLTLTGGFTNSAYVDGIDSEEEAAAWADEWRTALAVRVESRPNHKPDAADVVELRQIGEWMNRNFPTDEDSDGDRIIAAAAALNSLRADVVEWRMLAETGNELLHEPLIHLDDLLPALAMVARIASTQAKEGREIGQNSAAMLAFAMQEIIDVLSDVPLVGQPVAFRGPSVTGHGFVDRRKRLQGDGE